ncbi:MAG TPA: DUF1013 domain-containing protein [Alphaproteobacteria bacterium]|nr:DUF1013 domain-containing protein [Rhodospirillaceae bacterium]HRJ12883.1 DUF1013 domain-containing protein [Alphaproteobacteria bacterium]
MAQPATHDRVILMPMSTAAWLVDNTTLTFEQIGDFCGLHKVKVEAIADGDIKVPARNPVNDGYITQEDLDHCMTDPNARLTLLQTDLPDPMLRAKGPRYVSVAKRADKPDGILWLLKSHPELKDGQIIRLIGTTKNTITSLRNRTHPNYSNLRARHPVLLGLCRQDELNAAILKSGGQLHPELPEVETSEQPEVEFTNWE